MNNQVSKNFFLISFLPAIAYWYLEENYPVRIAIMGGLFLSILEISLEKYFCRHVHTLSKFNFFLIAFLGGISLLGDDGIWFKLQPAFTGVGIGGFLSYRLIKGKGMMQEMVESFNQRPPPEFIIHHLERNIAGLFFIYGLFMIFVALKMDTDSWLFFKTIGFYIVFAFFMLAEFFLIRVLVQKELKKEQ